MGLRRGRRMALMVGLLSAASAPVRVALRRTLQRSSLTAVLGKLSSAQINAHTNRVRPGVIYLFIYQHSSSVAFLFSKQFCVNCRGLILA